jgi:predicted nucleotidyltransferase
MDRKIIYKTESGSYLYGTNTEASDKDYVSVFILTNYDILSLQKCDHIDESTKKSSSDRKNTSEDFDDQQYSISNYLHLVLNNNPNLTEILFAENPIIEDDTFTIFKKNVDKLISRNVYKSFTGFAYSQKKKLEYKSKRFTQLEKSLAYLEKEYPRDITDDSSAMGEKLALYLNENLSEYKGKNTNIESFHKGLPLKTACENIKKEYESYGWRVKTESFSPLGYDVKFASHALRLYHEGERLLATGRLEFPIKGSTHDDIMAVKTGNATIEEFYELCARYEGMCHKAFESTVLPEKADWKWANTTLVNILTDSILHELGIFF